MALRPVELNPRTEGSGPLPHARPANAAKPALTPLQIVYAAFTFLGDVALISASVLIAFYLRFDLRWFGPVLEQHRLSDYALLIGVQNLTIVGIFVFTGGYVFRRHFSKVDELQRTFVTISIGTVVTLAVSAFFEREFFFSRSIILVSWIMAIVMVWGFRVLTGWTVSELLRRGIAPQRVAIIGTGEMGQVIHQKIEAAPELGYAVVGYIAENPLAAPRSVLGRPVIGNINDVNELLPAYGINELIVADPSLSHKRIMDIVSQCAAHPVDIKVFPDVFQIMSSQVSVGDLNGLPMLAVRDAALRGYNLAIKRAVDIALSLFVLIFFSWFLLLVAMLVKLSDPRGPVFFVQERVGLNGESFPTLKFRSMYVDAEDRTGPVWARKGDPRVTPLGRILRRFSIDELPQFVNVLLGHMSVVGPRPERPHFVAQFSERLPRYLERHREKTGLTGWAQVNGLRGDTSIEERTAYDLWYVENWTLALDFKIMLRTIIAIFRDKNAY